MMPSGFDGVPVMDEVHRPPEVHQPATRPERTANSMHEYVMTVQGPISPDELGFTLMHEHLLTRFWHATHRFDLAGMPEDDRYIVEELAALTATGCKSLVDVTPIGINRNPAGLCAIWPNALESRWLWGADGIATATTRHQPRSTVDR